MLLRFWWSYLHECECNLSPSLSFYKVVCIYLWFHSFCCVQSTGNEQWILPAICIQRFQASIKIQHIKSAKRPTRRYLFFSKMFSTGIVATIQYSKRNHFVNLSSDYIKTRVAAVIYQVTIKNCHLPWSHN